MESFHRYLKQDILPRHWSEVVIGLPEDMGSECTHWVAGRLTLR